MANSATPCLGSSACSVAINVHLFGVAFILLVVPMVEEAH